MTPQEVQDNFIAGHIYADFKWALKIKDHTYESIDRELARAINRCKTEIMLETIRDKAVGKLQEMRNKLSEFTV